MDNSLDLRGTHHPEIVVGLVGALGTPLSIVCELLVEELGGVGYDTEVIRMTDYIRTWENLPTEYDRDAAAGDRFHALMSRGNELCSSLRRSDALAMLAVVEINLKRPEEAPQMLEKRAFVLHQLKRPEEVRLLRQVYGDAFHLVGVSASQRLRLEYLNAVRNIPNQDALKLIGRDADEEIKFGQQLTKTFHHADLFVEIKGIDDSAKESVRPQITRYLDLLFGREIVTPTKQEYGMYLAYSASLRSGDLSRQVGAAVFSNSFDVLGVGCNEVPAPHGGQYWGEEDSDRDVERGEDANTVLELECIAEILELTDDEWKNRGEDERSEIVRHTSEVWKHTRLMNLTEFGRPVHAEMEALLSAGRIGCSTRDGVLFTTTFPCHNCAKHIVGSGIAKVTYIEPYAKSLASRLYKDSIAIQLGGEVEDGGRVLFSPFHGVSPKRFARLFAMVDPDGKKRNRKNSAGKVIRGLLELRLAASPLTHVDRESVVGQFLNDTMNRVIEGAGEADE